jgi:hypothetical protein
MVTIAYDFFNEALGTATRRSNSINLTMLGLLQLNADVLEAKFTEKEAWNTIRALSPEPNGFTARFLQVTWPVIRPDLMAAFDAFWHLHFRNLHSTNDAFLILLPKSQDAASIKDYRPISLIHLLGKLISKVVANRLAPRLESVIHLSKGAFLRGRVIHDNFRFV